MSAEHVMSKHIIIDGLPKNTGPSKVEKFRKFLLKKIADKTKIEMALVTLEFFFAEDGNLDGAFLGFKKASDMERAVSLLHKFPITTKDTLSVHKWETLDIADKVSDEYEAPDMDTDEKEMDTANNMMHDPDCRPLFFTKTGGPDHDVAWHWFNWKTNKIVLNRKPSSTKADTFGQWTELDRTDPKNKITRVSTPLPMWSPFGTYLVSQHRDGIKLWAGRGMNLVLHVDETDIHDIQISPNEKFLVVKSASDVSLWSIRLAKKLRSLHGLDIDTDSWPVVQFSADDRLCSVVKKEKLIVYDTTTMNVVRGENAAKGVSLDMPGLVDAQWSPHTGTQLAIVVRDDMGWRVEIANVIVEYEEEIGGSVAKTFAFDALIRRNFLTADVVKVLWHPSGTHVAAKVVVPRKGVEYCLFRVGYSTATAEQLTIAGSAIRFNWQLGGHMFAVIVQKGDSLTLQVYDADAKPTIKLMGSVTTSGESLLWSPKNTRIVSFNFDRSVIELYGVDEKAKKLISYGRREHQFCNNVEWDPSGRFLVSWTGCSGSKGRNNDNRYIIGDLNGRILNTMKFTDEKLAGFSFRPLSKAVLNEADITAVKKELPAYIKNSLKSEADEAQRSADEILKKKTDSEATYTHKMNAIVKYHEQQKFLETRRKLIWSSASAMRHREEVLGNMTETITKVTEEVISKGGKR